MRHVHNVLGPFQVPGPPDFRALPPVSVRGASAWFIHGRGSSRDPGRTLAVEVGFEPTEGLPPHTLSRRAPSATRPPHPPRAHPTPVPTSRGPRPRTREAARRSPPPAHHRPPPAP